MERVAKGVRARIRRARTADSYEVGIRAVDAEVVEEEEECGSELVRIWFGGKCGTSWVGEPSAAWRPARTERMVDSFMMGRCCWMALYTYRKHETETPR